MARRRSAILGWLGPAVVILGVIAAVAGAWYTVTARPEAGAVIDTIPIDATSSLVVRAEVGGDRNFVELRHGDELEWHALVPPYAGRPGAPGIAWGEIAVTVRVIRNGQAEVFALHRRDASKIGGFRLAPQHGPVVKQTVGPVTLTDHERSYEVVSGAGWNQLVGIDLATGEAIWMHELGDVPVVDGGVDRGLVWVKQGPVTKTFVGRDGKVVEGLLDFQF